VHDGCQQTGCSFSSANAYERFLSYTGRTFFGFLRAVAKNEPAARSVPAKN